MDPATTTMRFVKYFLFLALLAALISWVMVKNFESQTPDIIENKLLELKNSKLVLDSIGGYLGFEINYDDYEFRFRDTVVFNVRIIGKDYSWVFKGVARRQGENWALFSEENRIGREIEFQDRN